uniref:Uncharacterized protein n=1 Tax=Phytophthora cinnamomi TaxID=4785 RepID=B8Y7T8_PHYCI|nr:hypothetical protein [Phytophthora cinnamomi]
MQGIFTLALLLLNGWLGLGAEAVDDRRFMGGAVVENKNCNDCATAPVVHTLLAHTSKDKENN